MVKKIALSLALAIGVLLASILGIAATRPNTFRVERSTTVQASADKIYPHINDFHAWTAWSPFEKMDLAMKKTYTGAATGVGAKYEWNGDDKVGQGRMEITESVSPSKVVIKLDFIKPFEASNIAEFTMVPEGNATKVTWAMIGNHNYMSKVMCMFFSMDKMVGGDFEKGLASLKAIAEK